MSGTRKSSRYSIPPRHSQDEPPQGRSEHGTEMVTSPEHTTATTHTPQSEESLIDFGTTGLGVDRPALVPTNRGVAPAGILSTGGGGGGGLEDMKELQSAVPKIPRKTSTASDDDEFVDAEE